MRSCGWLLLAACGGDPSLHVAVDHPSDEAIAQTVVTVYFGGGVACTDIEFGDRTESELAAITADEVDVTQGGRVDVSRLGGKSLVARGFDADRRFVTAGCQDVGEITAGTELTIATQPTAVVAIDPQQPDRPFAERTILVNMTDPHGRAIDGTVSWQLSGPDGAVEPPPAAGVATVDGDAEIRVADLGTPGPEAMRIRVPWATSPLPLVTAFDLAGATTIALPGGPGGPTSGAGVGHPSCDVRGHAGGLPSLVCLAPATVLGHRDVLEISWQTDHYAIAVRPVPNNLGNQFALFVDHDGSAEEPVYVIGGNAPDMGTWFKLGAQSASPVKFEGTLQNLVYVPRCSNNSVASVVGVQTVDLVLNKRAFFSATGVAIQPDGAALGEVLSGGCVSDVDGIDHQAVVASAGVGDPALTLISGGEPMPLACTTKLNGSGFVAVASQGVTEQRFVGTRLQATGTVVFEAVLAPEGTSYKLVERTEIEAAAPPTKILGGQLDRDGETDLMWDLAAGVRRRVYQVSLAKQVSGVPLTAITSGASDTASLVASDFVLGNLNGGTADEMIVFTQSSVTIYSAD